MTQNPLTQEEKIDAIYLMLKKSESRARMQVFFKVLFWITMFAYSYYVMVYTLPGLIKSFMPSMPSIQGNAGAGESNQDILHNSQMQKLLDLYMNK